MDMRGFMKFLNGVIEGEGIRVFWGGKVSL